jgi:hypothetical protein
VNKLSFISGSKLRPVRWNVIVGLSALVAFVSVSGCSQSENSTSNPKIPSVGVSNPVTFVGAPGERDCEALQATEPSSSYKSSAPMRSDTGDAVTISGVVLAYPTCQSVSGATVEFWYAAEDGSYKDDLRRGRLITDKQGGFKFSVEMPGGYSDGNGQPVPSHVHIWVSGIGILARGMTVMTEENVVKTVATVVMPTGV